MLNKCVEMKLFHFPVLKAGRWITGRGIVDNWITIGAVLVAIFSVPITVLAMGSDSQELNKEVKQTVSANSTVPSIELSLLGSYKTGIVDDSSAEIVAYDATSKRLFVTNASQKTVDVISIANPSKPKKVKAIKLKAYGSPNSVAVKNGVVAVAVEPENAQQPGSVVLFNTEGVFLNKLMVGAMPDMLTFAPNGKHILVANEGEPNDDYTIDPEGSVSIIDMHFPVEKMTQAAVRTAGFTQFNDIKVNAAKVNGVKFDSTKFDSAKFDSAKQVDSIRILGPKATVAQDLEPEYITVSNDSSTAWLVLQENNALAVLDIKSATFRRLLGFGTKSFNSVETAIDASDKDDGINIVPWPVLSFYQPDAIASYEVAGETYLVTANEGDARDYSGFSELERVSELALSPSLLEAYPDLQDKHNLGRLKVSGIEGDKDNDRLIDQIYGFGARSFSVWSSKAELLYDSGSDFARLTASLTPKSFNGEDKRSDDKGSEPESVVIGKVAGQFYAFIGLERANGIMVYNVSNPRSPFFVQYVSNFDSSGNIDGGSSGDVGPEGLAFISKQHSSIGNPMLVVANEVSGTTSLYEINSGFASGINNDKK